MDTESEGTKMKKYRIEVFFSASQVIEVEAEETSEAINEAFMMVDEPTEFKVDDYEIECLEDEDEN